LSPLTDRQRNLLTLANQLSQNLINNTGNNTGSNSGINTDVSVDLPGLDLDVDLNLGRRRPDPTPPAPPTPPTTIREVLLSLVNERVQVTTPFDVITGTLIAVRDDYIVVIENSGAQVLIRINKIELVSEM
jgi:hypothetical protein